MLTTANRSSSTTLSVDHRELDAARALLGVVVSPLPTTVPPPSTRSSSAAADVTETLSLSVMAEPNENVYVGATDRLAFPAMSVPTSSSASLTEGNCAADVTMSEGDKAEYELPTARSSDDDYFCMMAQTNSSDAMATEDFPFRKRSRAESVGLDALAALASQEQAKVVSEASTMTTTGADSVNGADSHCSNNSTSKVSFAAAAASPITSSSSSDEDSAESMPPPPPRYRRRRAASNPEGMEKWDSLQESERHHFVLPASILEVELAEASAAVEQQGRRLLPKIREDSSHQPEDEHEQEEEDDDEEEEVVDESTLTPEELLRRARSRLLEDLSECTVNGEKGVITLPHALGKYKEVRRYACFCQRYGPLYYGLLLGDYHAN